MQGSNQRKNGTDSRTLAVEIEAYRHESARLEAAHMGKWVVFKDQILIAIYNSFDDAAADAVARFGHGPFLIRQIGAPPIVMPISVAYNSDA